MTLRDSTSVEELDKNGDAYSSNHLQNQTEREGEPFPAVFWHLLRVGEVAFPLLLTPEVPVISVLRE